MVNGDDGCLSAAALRSRVARYAEHSQSGPALQVLVRSARGSVEFTIRRGSNLLARRRFDALPAGCGDRRDTLALSIAVAVESVAQEMGSNDAPQRTPRVSNVPSSSNSAVTAETSASTAQAPAAFDVENTQEGTPPGPESAGAASQAEPPVPEPGQSVPRAEAEPASTASARAAPQLSPDDGSSDNEQDSSSQDEDEAETRLPHLSVHAGASYTLDLLPGSALAFSVGLELALGPRFSVWLSGIATLPTRITVVAKRTDAQALGGEALACGWALVAPLRTYLCAGVRAGAVFAAGQDYYMNFEDRMSFVQGVVMLALRLPIAGPLDVSLWGAGHLNVVRPRMDVGRSEGRSPKLLGATAGLLLHIAWP